MSKIDLNLAIGLSHFEKFRGMVHEPWPNDLCSTEGPASARRISSLCRTLPRRLQGAEFLLSGSIFVPGLCPGHLPRESARHRNLLARSSLAALSHGLSGWHLAQHPGQRPEAKSGGILGGGDIPRVRNDEGGDAAATSPTGQPAAPASISCKATRQRSQTSG